MPLLPQYDGKRCQTPTVACDLPKLQLWLAQNGLKLREDTVADGNCGPHSFGLSLIDCAQRNPSLKTGTAWKEFSKASKDTSKMIAHLRTTACRWMKTNADTIVWDGMPFRNLACAMSYLQEPYEMHIRRLSADKEWIDASVIHALACAFRVDVAIWQEHLEPMIVGFSLLDKGEAKGLLTIALKNDCHFWAVVVADTKQKPSADSVACVSLDDWVALPREISDPRRQPCFARDDDDDEEECDDGALTMTALVDFKPPFMDTADVDAELELCSCLPTWDPWQLPSDCINAALGNIRSKSTAHRCKLREQVVADMVWETANADSLPDRLKYNAASRYRLRTGRISPTTLVNKSKFAGALEALQTHALIDVDEIDKQLRATDCPKHSRPHTCLDPFRADPRLIRIWRVLWNCLPAYIRRERLMAMF